MGYRYEQTESETEIVIDGWEHGIGDNPYEGFIELSYGSITNTPGEFAAQFPLVASTLTVGGGTAMGVPIQIATQLDAGNGGTVTKYILLDSKGQIWTSNTLGNAVTWTYRALPDGNTVSTVGNSGIVYWKGYAIMIRAAKIYYANDTNFASWTEWTAAYTPAAPVSGSTHYAISASDDAVYFCNGFLVASILQNAGSTFDPTSASTYTANMSALSLPTNDLATCLAELQANLLIGGALNRVYNWDRINTTYNNIIYLAERYVQRMVTTNTNTYIFVGHPVIPTGRGNIYVTNGSQVDPYKKIPDFFVNLITPATSTIQEPYWVFGDAMYHRNMLVFSVIAYSNVSGAIISGTGGIWAIGLTPSKPLFRLNRFPASESVLASVLLPNNTGTTINGLGYFAGYSAVMANTTNDISTGLAAIFCSPLIPVGTTYDKKTFTNLEIKTQCALGASDVITLTYITDTLASATIGTMTSSDGVGKVLPVNFQGSQWLRIFGSLTPGASSTFLRTTQIRLR